jgi:hypothetical protein
MARLLYWSVYKLDLGPFGRTTLNLAPRVWLLSRVRTSSYSRVRTAAAP